VYEGKNRIPSKLKPGMNLDEMTKAMVRETREGVPDFRALIPCYQIALQSIYAGEINAAREFILCIDEFRIYGNRLYRLWLDVCKEDMETMLSILLFYKQNVSRLNELHSVIDDPSSGFLNTGEIKSEARKKYPIINRIIRLYQKRLEETHKKLGLIQKTSKLARNLFNRL